MSQQITELRAEVERLEAWKKAREWKGVLPDWHLLAKELPDDVLDKGKLGESAANYIKSLRAEVERLQSVSVEFSKGCKR